MIQTILEWEDIGGNAINISRERLIELVTLLIDGMILDDENSAEKYFEKTCGLTQAEREFFIR